ncbi:quinol monooxygenase YgiN [Devosia sp. UYZn731]|uniref:putative quinol monooxygenase n=1 Tax=Devosia sp. UYZn731 TaxID=3156345 RepID=UPI0033946B8E
MRKTLWTVRLKLGTLAEVMQAGQVHIAASRAEPGCISFDFFVNADGSDSFMSIEQYVDEAAHQAHKATPHFQTFIPYLVERVESVEMDWCEPPDEAHPAP